MKTTLCSALCLTVVGAGALLAQPAYFTRITEGPIATDAQRFWGCALADYDNDGLVDVFVASGFETTNALYHNDGNFNFIKVTAEPVVMPWGNMSAGVFADYDNDGDLDLLTTGYGCKSCFFRNDSGAGNATRFTRITAGSWVNVVATSNGTAWGDYDNDGFVDLAVVNSGTPGQNEFLYRNDGAGGMVPISAPPLTASGGRSQNCAWADYDGDGDLDLFVANAFVEVNFLFRNDGAGTFARVPDGDHVTTSGEWIGPAWGDYDNDGDLDLFVSQDNHRNDALYRNDARANGNTNGWLLVRLVGTASNRSAIGAKVRVRAMLGGAQIWQMREISGGSGSCSQNDLRAHFGLGNAAQVDLLRIEWPSGIVQELTNVAPKQILTVTEHQDGATNAPSLTVTKPAAGPVQLTATGQTNLRYVFEASTNLAKWTKIAVRTNRTGTVDFTPAASSSSAKFYRVQVP